MRVEEEGQPGRELIDVEARMDRGFHVGHAIAQCERHLLHRGGSGLAHVIPGDGNRVPVGHILFGPGKHVGDHAHSLVRRVNVSSASDVFLEHIVLHRTRKFADVCTLPARDSGVQGKQN